MALPNSVELDAIEELRSRVDDVLSEEELQDKMYLVRWLRARDLDINKAELMLRTNLKWRKERKVDTILERKIDPYFSEKFPRYIDAFDRNGNPVVTLEMGKWDFRMIAKDGKTPEDFMEYITEGFEIVFKLMKESTERRKAEGDSLPVTQFSTIFNFEGYPYGQLLNFRAMQNFLKMGSIYEAYYPEILHSAYFVNCPSFISNILLLLRPVLATKTMSKIKCLSPNDENWKEEIQKGISPEQIRPQFGGTMSLNGLILEEDSRRNREEDSTD